MLVKKEDIINTYSDRNAELTKKYIIACKLFKEGISYSKIAKIIHEPNSMTYFWFIRNGKPRAIQTIRWLKKHNLMSIPNFDISLPHHRIILILHAFMFGDGSLYKSQIELSGQKEDIELFEREFKLIFNDVNTYIIKNDTGMGEGYNLMIYSAELSRLLKALGCPVGDKVIKSYKLPDWLMNASKEVIKYWLEVFLGNEGTCLSIPKRRKRSYSPIYIGQSKILKFEKSEIVFLNQIRKLLAKFKIKTSKPKKHQESVRKNNNLKIGQYYFCVYQDVLNLLRFFNKFTFRYAIHKSNKNNTNIIRVEEKTNIYYQRILAFLYAQMARKLNLKWSAVKELYYNLSFLNKAVAWNTFYHSYFCDMFKPRYFDKILEFQELNFKIPTDDFINNHILSVVDIDG